MPKFSIDQQVTFLYTSDLSKTAHFYEEILGLPLALNQGTCRIYRVVGESFIGFCQRDSAPTAAEYGSQNVIITLVTAHVDDWFAHLELQGVTVEKSPAYNPQYNIYHCFLRDPNGYLIEIQQFLDPTWPAPEKE